MNIYTLDLLRMKATMLDCTNEKYIPIEITNPTVFLHQSLVIFSNVPLAHNADGLISMSKTIDTLPETIVTPNGFLDKDRVKALLVLLYHLPRSFFVRNMGKNTTLGSFTPLFMYAHKLYNDVPYSKWAKDDKLIDFALGKFLWQAIDRAPSGPITISGVTELRAKALTYLSGKKAGVMEKLTAYKMPLKLSDDNNVLIEKPTSFMLLQTWICNSEVRDTNSMILDPWDWGSVPEPYDAVVAKIASTPEDPGRAKYRDL